MGEGNRIKVRVDGPLLCNGEVRVYGADEALLQASDDIALCRCGASGNKPFCDGSHREAGFSDDGHFNDDKPEALAAAGPLEIRVHSNAMLMARGPVTIVSADDACTTTRNRAALCRCGASNNKPFCDGSHKTIGFTG